MAGTVCTPACAPNTAASLPSATPEQIPPPAPLATANGIDCNGVAFSVTAQGVAQSVPHPTAVQLVKLCNPNDYETNVLCDAATGARILVVTGISSAGVPTSTAYNLDGTVYAGALSALVSCGGSGEESDPVEMCDNGVTSFIRWVVKKDGAPTGASFNTHLDGTPYVPTGPVTFGNCSDQRVYIETGCLSSPPSYDIGRLNKCPVSEVNIGGRKFDIDLPANWSVTQFVNAINEISPGFLIQNGTVATLAAPNGLAEVPIEVICTLPDFTEEFGVGARTSSANTNYTYAPAGFVIDGSYAVATFSDPGLSGFNNQDFTLVNDARGNPNGRQLIVNADFAPGEFYRQPATLILGQEYRLEFWATSTNAAGYDSIKPNIRFAVQTPAQVDIEVGQTGDMQRVDKYKKYTLDFVATQTSIEFVLTNNAPGGSGNDLAIDRISFNRVERQLATMGPRSLARPVEIVKTLNAAGGIASIRVFNIDGTTEYTAPYDGNVLSVGSCPALLTSAAVAPDAETDRISETVPFCINGVTWYRTTSQTISNADGAVSGVTTSWFDGTNTQSSQPLGTITAGACAAAAGPSTSVEVVEGDEPGCANGVPWNRRRTGFFNGVNGNLINTTVSYVDSAGNAQAAAPAGFTLGACPAAATGNTTDFEETLVCANGVQLVMRTTRTYTNNGAIFLENTQFLGPTGPVANPAVFTYGACQIVSDQFQTVIQDVALGETFTIVPGTDLVSWTLRNRNSTNGTFQVNGGAVLPFDLGETISSGGVDEDSGTLTDTINIVAGNGVIRITVLRRA